MRSYSNFTSQAMKKPLSLNVTFYMFMYLVGANYHNHPTLDLCLSNTCHH